MINYLFDIESRRYPFYQIVEIEVISDKDGVIKYRTCVDSKISPGWKKWEPTREIKFSELVVEMRDDKIKRILE